MNTATFPALRPAERRLVLQSRKTTGFLDGAFNARVLAGFQALGHAHGLIRRQGPRRIITEAGPAAAKGWSAGQRVYAARTSKGWTQQDLADHSGIARANIARIEAGRHAPQVDTLRRVAQALQVPLTWILEVPGKATSPEYSTLAEGGLSDWARELDRLDKEDSR